MLDKQAVAERIWEIEWQYSKNLSGIDLLVENVRIDEKKKVAIADVVIVDRDDPNSDSAVFCNSVVYSFSALKI